MKPNVKFWRRATDARAKLKRELEANADVCDVDIGYPQNNDKSTREISLRIHKCEDSDQKDPPTFPKEVDGIPVVIAKSKRKSQKP